MLSQWGMLPPLTRTAGAWYGQGGVPALPRHGDLIGKWGLQMLTSQAMLPKVNPPPLDPRKGLQEVSASKPEPENNS